MSFFPLCGLTYVLRILVFEYIIMMRAVVTAIDIVGHLKSMNVYQMKLFIALIRH